MIDNDPTSVDLTRNFFALCTNVVSCFLQLRKKNRITINNFSKLFFKKYCRHIFENLGNTFLVKISTLYSNANDLYMGNKRYNTFKHSVWFLIANYHLYIYTCTSAVSFISMARA